MHVDTVAYWTEHLSGLAAKQLDNTMSVWCCIKYVMTGSYGDECLIQTRMGWYASVNNA